MDMNVIYVGLDVDDTQYHGSALNKDTGDVITFQCGRHSPDCYSNSPNSTALSPIALSASATRRLILALCGRLRGLAS